MTTVIEGKVQELKDNKLALGPKGLKGASGKAYSEDPELINNTKEKLASWLDRADTQAWLKSEKKLTDEQIAALRAELGKKDGVYFKSNDPSKAVDAEDAVKLFQEQHQLKTDGVYGFRTAFAMEKLPTEVKIPTNPANAPQIDPKISAAATQFAQSLRGITADENIAVDKIFSAMFTALHNSSRDIKPVVDGLSQAALAESLNGNWGAAKENLMKVLPELSLVNITDDQLKLGVKTLSRALPVFSGLKSSEIVQTFSALQAPVETAE